MVIKLIKRFAYTCLVFTSLSVNAIPMYDIDSGGQITGVSGVMVGTDVYDATFNDGSFNDIFAADPTAIYSEAFALIATQSLSDFFAASFLSGGYDHSEITGCLGGGSIRSCALITATGDPLFTNTINGTNFHQDFTTSFGGSGLFSTGNFSDQTWITWRAPESSTVPEPSIILLLASGLVAFGLVRRKTRV